MSLLGIAIQECTGLPKNGFCLKISVAVIFYLELVVHLPSFLLCRAVRHIRSYINMLILSKPSFLSIPVLFKYYIFYRVYNVNMILYHWKELIKWNVKLDVAFSFSGNDLSKCCYLSLITWLPRKEPFFLNTNVLLCHLFCLYFYTLEVIVMLCEPDRSSHDQFSGTQ